MNYQITNLTLYQCSAARSAVSLAVSLLERRAIFALVVVAGAVAAVVVVVAFAIPLRPDRVEAVAIARVVAAGLDPVAVAGVGGGRAVGRRDSAG